MTAMLVQVEAFDFAFLRHAQGARRFHGIHQDHRGNKYTDTDRRISFDLGDELARRERTRRAARQLARRLKIASRSVTGINWFCSGYPRAMSQVTQRILPRLNMRQDQFVLVVTASRISRITDYGCPQTAGLFGDLATATLISKIEGPRLADTTKHTLRDVDLGEDNTYLIADYPVTQEVLETHVVRSISFLDDDIDSAEAFVLREVQMNAVMLVPLVVRGRAWGLVERRSGVRGDRP